MVVHTVLCGGAARFSSPGLHRGRSQSAMGPTPRTSWGGSVTTAESEILSRRGHAEPAARVSTGDVIEIDDDDDRDTGAFGIVAVLDFMDALKTRLRATSSVTMRPFAARRQTLLLSARTSRRVCQD